MKIHLPNSAAALALAALLAGTVPVMAELVSEPDDIRLVLPLPPDAHVTLPPDTDVTLPQAAAPAAAEAPKTEAAPVLAAPMILEPVPDVQVATTLPLNEAVKLAIDAWVRTPGLAASLRKEREAVQAFYATREFAPLWIAGGAFTATGAAAMGQLNHAADDGLDLRAYSLPVLASHEPADKLVAAELALSFAVIAYGRQASGGRVDPQRVSSLITARPETAEPGRILANVSAAGAGAGAALLAFNPPHKGYAALRAKLTELRANQKPQAQRIAPGPILRVGMRDVRVPLIRARFGLDVAVAQDTPEMTYDTVVANAVADFQRANGLPASGILTARTIAALSGGEPSRLENEILANMERWRWMPRDMGARRIEVNIPEFTVRLMNGDTVEFATRAVVGKPDTPTPIFSNTMQFLIVNPYWNVPQSIIKKEMMPKLAADPDYLHRLGYEVVQRGNTLIVRQPPGERNALGRIKFMFPNDHAVYLHDTPSRALFANTFRAYSHGCVRVDQPFKLAEAVLGAGWSEGRVKGLIGGPERRVDLPHNLPIHIEYFTAGVDDNGRLQLRDDIYGYSRRLKIAMGLED